MQGDGKMEMAKSKKELETLKHSMRFKGLNESCDSLEFHLDFLHYVCIKRRLSFARRWKVNPCEKCRYIKRIKQ